MENNPFDTRRIHHERPLKSKLSLDEFTGQNPSQFSDQQTLPSEQDRQTMTNFNRYKCSPSLSTMPQYFGSARTSKGPRKERSQFDSHPRDFISNLIEMHMNLDAEFNALDNINSNDYDVEDYHIQRGRLLKLSHTELEPIFQNVFPQQE